ncbi:hypothetical protein B4Q13_17585 [Lacticaseibacillus rhamnosus]
MRKLIESTLVSLDGVILTKVDGDARGGAALSEEPVPRPRHQARPHALHDGRPEEGSRGRIQPLVRARPLLRRLHGRRLAVCRQPLRRHPAAQGSEGAPRAERHDPGPGQRVVREAVRFAACQCPEQRAVLCDVDQQVLLQRCYPERGVGGVERDALQRGGAGHGGEHVGLAENGGTADVGVHDRRLVARVAFDAASVVGDPQRVVA